MFLIIKLRADQKESEADQKEYVFPTAYGYSETA